MRSLHFALLAAALLAAACTPQTPAGRSPELSAPAQPPKAVEAATSKEQILTTQPEATLPVAQPADEGWPREVETPRSVAVIEQKPQRIHTLSVGFDEITFALVDPSRVVAVGRASTNPDWSNVADLAAAVPNQVGRDAEQVLAAEPDLVVASRFSREDLVNALEGAGVTVVVADLHSSVDAHEDNIRFLARLYGEEEKGEQLISQVRERLAAVDRVVQTKPEDERPRALMLIGERFTPGEGSNETGIIQRAGGINAAAEAGIQDNQQISLESIPAMDPEVILLVEEDSSKRALHETVLGHPALQDLPAIKEERYFSVKHSYVTTLSHWNVRGVEELARIFYPDDFR